jgi:hypothetical protein
MLKKAVQQGRNKLSLLRGGWDDPNCARYSNPNFIFKGSLVDPRLRASHDINDPSKLARYLFRDGG